MASDSTAGTSTADPPGVGKPAQGGQQQTLGVLGASRPAADPGCAWRITATQRDLVAAVRVTPAVAAGQVACVQEQRAKEALPLQHSDPQRVLHVQGITHSLGHQ